MTNLSRLQVTMTCGPGPAEARLGKWPGTPCGAGAFVEIAAQFKLDLRSLGFLQRLRGKHGDAPPALVFPTEP
jgi:hypothetical protein